MKHTFSMVSLEEDSESYLRSEQDTCSVLDQQELRYLWYFYHTIVLLPNCPKNKLALNSKVVSPEHCWDFGEQT